MQYVLRQKIFAFGDDFTIKDEHGRDTFVVDGRALSLGDKLSFRDMSGNELVFIRQRLLAWGPTYELHRNGQVVATVKKALFTLFRARFSIDVPGPDDLEAQGDFLAHEYVFTRHGKSVATVSKRWFALSDTYGVAVEDGEDDALVLASAVVIDMASHGDEEHASKEDD